MFERLKLVCSLLRVTPLVALCCMAGCGGSASPQISPPPTVASVTVSPSQATITAGGQKQFSATAKDSSGNVISGVTFTWSTGTASVAVVNKNGLATGVSQGTSQVTATASSVPGSATLTVNAAVSGNVIPTSFFGFTINRECSISDTDSKGANCNNPESHSFPGLPLTWARSIGAGGAKWSDIVQCDPTGTVCPLPGSGCSKDGSGSGGSCPADQLVPNCTPNSHLPTDPTNCAYVWEAFDFWTKKFNNNSVDWMYGAYFTPDYLSVRGSRCTAAGVADFGPDASCVGPADSCGGTNTFKWGCDPPSDIDAKPGSGLADGTDQSFKSFVTAFMTHLQQNAEHIKYWEVWNEPNICKEWNHSDQSGLDCTVENPGGGPSTGTMAQLVRMAKDARSIIPTYDSAVKISAPPVVDTDAMNNYLQPILSSGGQEFDVIGFHGYYASSGGCPTDCPVPEYWATEWATLVGVLSATGQSAKPVLDTEFSWGETSNVTDPDMRAAQAARSYLLRESHYPALDRVNWYGEDFPIDLTTNPNNNNEPYGGTGEFWASGDTKSADHCSIQDPVQGGFDCPAGVAMTQVFTWTIQASFKSACTCSASPKGGSCTTSIPAGIWQCGITRPNGYLGLLVWDSTATTFPCSNAACGSTTFTIPAAYTSDWQDLNGNVTPLSGATTVTIGAKPILIETLGAGAQLKAAKDRF